MATETFVIDSTLSPETAFRRVIDLLRVNEWDRGVRDPQLIDGDPASLGARYQVTGTGFDGEPTHAVYELTTVEATSTFTMVGTHPDFRAEDIVTFESTSKGCRVTYEASLVLLGDQPPLSDAWSCSDPAAVIGSSTRGSRFRLSAVAATAATHRRAAARTLVRMFRGSHRVMPGMLHGVGRLRLS